MRVILFIGHHKVGSTALQDFLARNSVALAQAGILYPSVDFEGMALMLATATGRHEPPDVLPINAREPHNALAFRMLAEHRNHDIPPFHKGLPGQKQMVRAIRKQIEFLSPETVILAAEVFANFAPAGADLITFLHNIFPAGTEFTVIATLRRIDEYLASWHGQRLKFGHDVAPLRTGGMEGYFGNIHFDYRLMLGGWLDTLPEARFVLRDYGAVMAAGGSVADFIAQTGLEFPQGLVAEQKTNESLHRGIYEIARRGNQALPGPMAGKLRKFLRDMTPHLDLPDSGTVELFGADNRRIMMDRFAPIHGFLEQASGRSPFFADLDAARAILPNPEAAVCRQALDGLCRRLDQVQEPEVRAFLKQLRTEPGL